VCLESARAERTLATCGTALSSASGCGNAARLEREAEERIRSERDWHCERTRQQLRDEAERNKWSAFNY
jgi:hypothetical protein